MRPDIGPRNGGICPDGVESVALRDACSEDDSRNPDVAVEDIKRNLLTTMSWTGRNQVASILNGFKGRIVGFVIAGPRKHLIDRIPADFQYVRCFGFVAADLLQNVQQIFCLNFLQAH